jgi:hypothetical protein
LQRRRARIGFDGQQVGYGIARNGKPKVRCIYDFWRERTAAGDLDGLGAMVSFVSAGLATRSGLRATEIFGAGKFIAGVVDDVVAGQPGRDVRAQLVELHRHNDRGKDQESLDQPTRDHAAIRKHAVRNLASKASSRARQSRADRRGELMPRRRPLDQ